MVNVCGPGETNCGPLDFISTAGSVNHGRPLMTLNCPPKRLQSLAGERRLAGSSWRNLGRRTTGRLFSTLGFSLVVSEPTGDIKVGRPKHIIGPSEIKPGPISAPAERGPPWKRKWPYYPYRIRKLRCSNMPQSQTVPVGITSSKVRQKTLERSFPWENPTGTRERKS